MPPTVVVPPVAPVSAKPTSYWLDTSLQLKKGHHDAVYEKAKKQKANVPHNYVSDLQKDLIELGYLKTGANDGDFGNGTERALKRFQRHAKRAFRMLNSAKISGASWTGAVTGICDQSTAKEIRNWIDKKYRLPLGIYKITAIDGGKLRDDLVTLWKAALDDATKKGGSLLPVGKDKSEYYSDTWRNPSSGFKSTGGNSKLSLHYTGRAVDLSMEPAGGKGQRWWIEKESLDGKIYWRIFCKTDKQDGTEGTQIVKKSKKYYEFYKNEGEKWMPEAYYIDLTELLASHEFERIPAQDGWESVAKKQEWWHFYYAKEIQETFGDEMSLIGYSEDQLSKWGWTQADMDKAPG